MTQQAIDHIFTDAVLEFFTGNRGRIEEGPPILAPVENLFSEQAIERGHQRRIRDSLFEGYVDVAHADFTTLPGLVEDLPLEFAKRERSHFAGPAKSAQEESRSFHAESILNQTSRCVNSRFKLLNTLR